MKRYSVLPITLYRFQKGIKPILRQMQYQRSQGRSSFDFILGPNKMYNPAIGDVYKKPNGLSLRPFGVNLAQYLQDFSGQFIIELPKNLVLPQNCVVIHQNMRNDHYSLQTTKSVDPQEFCLQMQKLFKKQKLISKQQLGKLVFSHFQQKQ